MTTFVNSSQGADYVPLILLIYMFFQVYLWCRESRFGLIRRDYHIAVRKRKQRRGRKALILISIS